MIVDFLFSRCVGYQYWCSFFPRPSQVLVVGRLWDYSTNFISPSFLKKRGVMCTLTKLVWICCTGTKPARPTLQIREAESARERRDTQVEESMEPQDAQWEDPDTETAALWEALIPMDQPVYDLSPMRLPRDLKEGQPLALTEVKWSCFYDKIVMYLMGGTRIYVSHCCSLNTRFWALYIFFHRRIDFFSSIQDWKMQIRIERLEAHDYQLFFWCSKKLKMKNNAKMS